MEKCENIFAMVFTFFLEAKKYFWKGNDWTLSFIYWTFKAFFEASLDISLVLNKEKNNHNNKAVKEDFMSKDKVSREETNAKLDC